MIKKFLHTFVLFSFTLSNSNLFVYQHYCGNELYGTALFHTLTCECNDNVRISDNNQWIVSNDDDCCKEIVIYAHNPDNFLFIQLLTTLFFLLSTIIIVRFVFKIKSTYLLNTLSSFLKRRRKTPFHIFISYHHIRTIVLRN